MSLRKRASQIDAITEYLFVEGYADTIGAAEAIAESMSLQWAQEILSEARYGNLAHTFPLTPSERRSAENIGRTLEPGYSDQSDRKKSAKQVEPEQPKRKKSKLDFQSIQFR